MRRFSYLLLAACLCLPLVGCGGDAATTETPAAPAAEAGGEATEEAGSEAKEEAGSEAKEEGSGTE